MCNLQDNTKLKHKITMVQKDDQYTAENTVQKSPEPFLAFNFRFQHRFSPLFFSHFKTP